MKRLLLVLATLFSTALFAQDATYPSLLQGLPGLPWSGLKQNPLLEKSRNGDKLSLEYLWTFESWYYSGSGETKYRVIEKFKPSSQQKDSGNMVNQLFDYLIKNTYCSKVNDNLYSVGTKSIGFMKRVWSNKGLVFVIIGKAESFQDKREYSNIVNADYLTLE